MIPVPVLYGNYFGSHLITDILEQLHVLTHKMLQEKAPKALSELFKISENEKYNLRSYNNMLI